MAKRRRHDPSQQSLLDLMQEPEQQPVAPDAEKPSIRRQAARSSNESIPTPSTHPVYKPKLWLCSALIALSPGLMFFLTPQEAMSVSYKFALALVLVGLGALAVTLALVIPSRHFRDVYVHLADRKRARTFNGVIVGALIVVSGFCFASAVNIAGDEFKRDFSKISEQWALESNKRDWKRKTKTLRAKGQFSEKGR